MSKKNVDPRFAVVDDSIKIPRFPIHHNPDPFEQRMCDDGTIEYVPKDTLHEIKVKGFVSTDKLYDWEVYGKGFEKTGNQWVKSKKSMLVGYIHGITHRARYEVNSKFLTESIGMLLDDIREHEAEMKRRMGCRT